VKEPSPFLVEATLCPGCGLPISQEHLLLVELRLSDLCKVEIAYSLFLSG
jgi:hypothetical protein